MSSGIGGGVCLQSNGILGGLPGIAADSSGTDVLPGGRALEGQRRGGVGRSGRLDLGLWVAVSEREYVS